MADIFAPRPSDVTSAPFTPVQTSLARPARPRGGTTAAIGAAFQGLTDVFDIAKGAIDRHVEDDIKKQIEQVEQETVNEAVSRNLGLETSTTSVAGDGLPDTPGLPPDAVAEIERGARAQRAADAGHIGQNESLVTQVAGVRRIKAQYPSMTAEIDAFVANKLGYRPSNVLVQRAFRQEAEQEARETKQADLDFAAGHLAFNKTTGQLGPYLLPNGQVDVDKTMRMGRRIRVAKAEADQHAAAMQSAKAGLELKRAQFQFGKEVAETADREMLTKTKRVVDNLVMSQLGPTLETIGQGFSRQDIENMKPDEVDTFVTEWARQVDATIERARRHVDINSMNKAEVGEINSHFDRLRENLMRPVVDKDVGLAHRFSRLLSMNKDQTDLAIMKLAPTLYALGQMGPAGGHLAQQMLDLDPQKKNALIAEVQEVEAWADENTVVEAASNITNDPNALAKLKGRNPGLAKVAMNQMSRAMRTWVASNDPMDEASARSFFNTMFNMATAVGSLENPDDYGQVIDFYSDPNFVRRYEELQKIDPDRGAVMGKLGVYALQTAANALGRDLVNSPGFGDTWDAVVDREVGAVVYRELKETPSVQNLPRGSSVIQASRFASQRARRAESAAGFARVEQINRAVRSAHQVQRFDPDLAGMSDAQVADAILTGPQLAGLPGIGKSPAFESPATRDVSVTRYQQSFENVDEAVTRNLDAFVRGSRALRLDNARETLNSLRGVARERVTAGRTSEGRLIVRNRDGSFSSEITVTVTDPRINEGRPTNIPTMYNGFRVSEDEARDIIARAGGTDPDTGRVLPSFESTAEAEQAAAERSAALGTELQGLLSPKIRER